MIKATNSLIAFAVAISFQVYAKEANAQESLSDAVSVLAVAPCMQVGEDEYLAFRPNLKRQSMPALFGFRSEVYARKGGEFAVDWTGSALVRNTGQGRVKIAHDDSGETFHFVYDDRSEFELYFAVAEEENGDEFTVQCRPAPQS